MRILLTVGSVAPECGGPSLSVCRLASALANAGHEVGVWAADGSAADSKILNDVEHDGTLFRRLVGDIESVFADFGQPNIVHDNGVWHPSNHSVASIARRRGGIARVVSPHGMLEPWAYNYKPIKKRLAYYLYQRRDLATAQALHATAGEEAASIARFNLEVPIEVVPNGVDLPDLSVSEALSGESGRTIVFLSRIHPKKGLPLLIEAFARLRPTGWRVIIAGPDELGHSAEIKVLAARAGLANSVEIVGPVWGKEKTVLLAQADLFVLPTYSENFGIAVAEALAHAVPVLTTTGAPWRLLVEEGCGWWVRPTVDGISAGLAEALATPAEARRAMGKRGRAAVSARFSWDKIAQQMLALYASAEKSRANTARWKA